MIDLHIHSLYSIDGEFTPAELIRRCKDAGVSVTAIADHNSVRAVPEALREAEKSGIKCIPATEIDCCFKGVNLHVLGYGIDYESPDFFEMERANLEAERRASRLRLALTESLGFKTTPEELDATVPSERFKGFWTGEAFGEVLLSKPEYADRDLLKPYRAGGSRSDNPCLNFYWDFYAQGKPCHVPMNYPNFGAVVSVIRKNGGKAVLAHPGNNLKGRYELFDEMAPMLDGVEAFGSYHTKSAAEYFFAKAREYGLFVTCGSDYHGKTKPAVKLGENGCFVTDGVLLENLPF